MDSGGLSRPAKSSLVDTNRWERSKVASEVKRRDQRDAVSEVEWRRRNGRPLTAEELARVAAVSG